MAVGVPVVATDVSGIPELVRHGQTGLLAPSRDPAALAAAMKRLLEDPGLGASLAGTACEVLRRHFDLWETTRSLHDLMRHPRCCAPDAVPAAVGEARVEVGAPVIGEGVR